MVQREQQLLLQVRLERRRDDDLVLLGHVLQQLHLGHVPQVEQLEEAVHDVDAPPGTRGSSLGEAVDGEGASWSPCSVNRS